MADGSEKREKKKVSYHSYYGRVIKQIVYELVVLACQASAKQCMYGVRSTICNVAASNPCQGMGAIETVFDSPVFRLAQKGDGVVRCPVHAGWAWHGMAEE